MGTFVGWLASIMATQLCQSVQGNLYKLVLCINKYKLKGREEILGAASFLTFHL